jgi:hypothetical protein
MEATNERSSTVIERERVRRWMLDGQDALPRS